MHDRYQVLNTTISKLENINKICLGYGNMSLVMFINVIIIKNVVSANVTFPTSAFILVNRQLNFIGILPDLINVHLIILSPHV